MIDISIYQQRLEWLREWMNKEIDRKGYWYGFKEYVFIDEIPRTLDMTVFNDFCIVKEYDLNSNKTLH